MVQIVKKKKKKKKKKNNNNNPYLLVLQTSIWNLLLVLTTLTPQTAIFGFLDSTNSDPKLKDLN